MTLAIHRDVGLDTNFLKRWAVFLKEGVVVLLKIRYKTNGLIYNFFIKWSLENYNHAVLAIRLDVFKQHLV